MRYFDAGESHGPGLVCIVEDVPAGLALSQECIDRDLARRQKGYGRGGRMKIERDHAEVLSGVRFSKTLGTPISMLIRNADHANWHGRMDVFGQAPPDLKRETTPRPGHADLVGALKTGTDDCRDVLERSSARSTATRVAAGAVARSLLRKFGVEVFSFVDRIGKVSLDEAPDFRGLDLEALEGDPLRCPSEEVSERMRAEIDSAKGDGDSLGGRFTVLATGLVPGLGSYATPQGRLGASLGGVLFSIPAIKAVEFGIGVESGSLRGSKVHDPIVLSGREGFSRASNNAGGLEGGMTTGLPLVIHATMKPIPTLRTPLPTVELDSRQPASASKERSDICAVPAAGVVAEAEVCMVLADAYQLMFGGANMGDMLAAFAGYASRIGWEAGLEAMRR